MDKPTFDLFKEFTVAGERNKAESLSLLDAEEHRLYETLKSMPGSNRLEQEKIPQAYADALIAQKIAEYESD